MIRARYDELTDALYVSLDARSRAFADEQPDGLLFRFASDTRKPLGVTVFAFSERWRLRQDQLASRISDFLRVPAEDIKRAMVRVAT